MASALCLFCTRIGMTFGREMKATRGGFGHIILRVLNKQIIDYVKDVPSLNICLSYNKF